MSMRRVLKEIAAFKADTPEGMQLLESDDMAKNHVIMEIPGDHPLYSGQKFLLRYKVSSDYPFDSPEVQFVRREQYVIPMHPHIYSNGHICLDILGNGWTPAQTLSSVAVSIQSMLMTNMKDERPQGDHAYVMVAPKNPKETQWVYHDDKV